MEDRIRIVDGDIFDILQNSVADAFGASFEFGRGSRPKIACIGNSSGNNWSLTCLHSKKRCHVKIGSN